MRSFGRRKPCLAEQNPALAFIRTPKTCLAERNHLGGISRTSFDYDLAGNVTRMEERHTTGPNDTTPDIKRITYTYDGRGRIVSETTTLGALTAMVQFEYDELGRLRRTKNCNGSGVVKAVSEQTYTLRGQRSAFTSDYVGGSSPVRLFSQTLHYEDAALSGSHPSYSGRISEQLWKHDSNNQKGYTYEYDSLGRLKDSNSFDNGMFSGAYAEKGISYDRNGNILVLTRMNGNGNVGDEYEYSYDGNKLSGINDEYEYSYDANGNMTLDTRRDLEIEYNVLNLPQTSSNGGSMFRYDYLSNGQKASVIDDEDNAMVYLGSLVYYNGEASGGYKLESTGYSGGRFQNPVVECGASPIVVGVVKDHLGSTRVIYDVSTGEILDQCDYCPFGSNASSGLALSGFNRYTFCDKEGMNMAVGNLHDFGARIYDSKIARWTSPDPLANWTVSTSPYQYCMGDPVKYMDPFGLWTTDENHMLIQEEGDDMYTLAEYLNIDLGAARIIWESQCFQALDDEMTPAYCTASAQSDSGPDIFNAISSTGSLLGLTKPFENSTYCRRPSDGKWFFWYRGWDKGNQYINRKDIKHLSGPVKKLCKLSNAILAISIIHDLSLLQDCSTGKISEDFAGEAICDLFVDAASQIPVCTPFCIAYSLCGEKIVTSYAQFNIWCYENGYGHVSIIDF